MKSTQRNFSITQSAAAVALAFGVTFLAACGGGGGTAPGSGKTKLAFITNAPDDFWRLCEAGTRKAEAECKDIEVTFIDGDSTVGKQKQVAQDLLVRGVKGLALSPINPADQVEMISEWAEDAAVLCVDSDAPASGRIAYLGTDNVAAGRKAGELVKEALPNGGKIMVFVGLGDAQNAKERFQGVNEALQGSNITVLGLRTDEANHDKARRNAEDTLTAHPDIAGMVGLWSYNAPAILKAVEGAGKVGEVKIIAFDEKPETLQAIDRGEMVGTVVQDPFRFGYESMKMLRALTVEGKTAQELNIPTEKQIFVDTKVIRKGEGQKYLDYCNELMASVKG